MKVEKPIIKGNKYEKLLKELNNENAALMKQTNELNKIVKIIEAMDSNNASYCDMQEVLNLRKEKSLLQEQLNELELSYMEILKNPINSNKIAKFVQVLTYISNRKKNTTNEQESLSLKIYDLKNTVILKDKQIDSLKNDLELSKKQTEELLNTIDRLTQDNQNKNFLAEDKIKTLEENLVKIQNEKDIEIMKSNCDNEKLEKKNILTKIWKDLKDEIQRIIIENNWVKDTLQPIISVLLFHYLREIELSQKVNC